MKIIQIVKTSDGANWAFEQALWLKKNGVNVVTILPSSTGKVADKYKENNMKVIEGDFSLPLFKPWLFFKRKKELLSIINEEKPDLIHFHFVTNILFGRLALRKINIPRLFQVPGPLHLDNKLIRKIEIGLSQKNDYWAPSCKYSKKIYEKYVDENRVFLSYYGGYGGESTKKYKKTNTLHTDYNISNKKIILGMVSYFYKPKYYLGQKRGIKGHEDLIDALSILNNKYDNLVAVIVGGPWGNSFKYENRVKKYASERNISNIIFTGFRNDVKDIYKEFSIAIHPSHSENLGGAAESLAAGIPTISTNVGGFPDIVIDGETGYTCLPKNPEDLAKTIEKGLENYSNMEKMAKKGQKLVEKLLDINESANEIKKIYIKIIEREK